ncbi:substrate-binding domain-containing protein [Aneurinibacillus sp. Ricciae_BoGa-3]|uniref:LacI family DNA-binding transcriptional regulator n=1 Tax=Aneurinibacillus sp. Ricciae_BoGa-3 TaxID=3022697 RepID=UPI0023406138|nr:substrate-binding domain-containing protein [Aneurinibacillus sp. Ricciae_BoGa-3]WCK56568.1 substrate-binding domain-containing protein [Aneurinibacillus sp. Ricciae_BoGa-3]
MSKITIHDVANLANVSKSTVSQYLNKRFTYMREETKQRIEEAIRELNYQPNIVARSLKQKRTSTIGVIVANILHTFSTKVIRAIEDICQEQDVHVIVCNADDQPEKEKRYIEMLQAKQVDGLIIFPTGGNYDLYESMIQQKYPIIFMDRIVQALPIPSFLLDNDKAARIAVDYFVEKGHSHIAIVTTSILRSITPRVERIDGYKRAIAANGLTLREDYIISRDIGDINSHLQKLFALTEPPTAILAGNDLALIEVLDFVKGRCLRIPQDIALIGIDDVSFAHIFSPSLTTISQPAYQMGTEAAALLLAKIKKTQNADTDRLFRYAPLLNIRGSV